jgi:hypothetical protein
MIALRKRQPHPPSWGILLLVRHSHDDARRGRSTRKRVLIRSRISVPVPGNPPLASGTESESELLSLARTSVGCSSEVRS